MKMTLWVLALAALAGCGASSDGHGTARSTSSEAPTLPIASQPSATPQTAGGKKMRAQERGLFGSHNTDKAIRNILGD